MESNQFVSIGRFREESLEELDSICYNILEKRFLRGKGDCSMVQVTLLAYTPQPEKMVAAAAKLCYSPAKIETVMDGLTEEKTASFLDMLSDLGHDSPVEHASFTFGIENVSRSLLAQITRHRIASFSVQSQRYVTGKMLRVCGPAGNCGYTRSKSGVYRGHGGRSGAL